jgi:transcriptional regulator with XRE-family HTH domain
MASMPISSISKHFRRAVYSRRIAASLSHEVLEERATLHPARVSMGERGVRNPTLNVSARIAKALEVGLPKLEEAQGQRATGRKELL